MRWPSILLLCTLSLVAVSSEPDSAHPCSPDGVAIGGYDLVSYHQPGGPLAGSANLELQREGLIYRFSSQENFELFQSNPQSYLPRYQGWCATTLSMGRLVCPDYTNFKIEDGQLLLFELAGFTNGRVLWDSDPTGFRTRADINANKLLK